ncbi:MAG: hypothetical protein ACK4MU_01870, partial [Thermomonas sp.]
RELLVLTLGRMDLHCDTASSLQDARALLKRHPYALCLTDMRLPDGSLALLGPGAQVELVASERERLTVEQSAGEVRYQVTKDPEQVFL